MRTVVDLLNVIKETKEYLNEYYKKDDLIYIENLYYKSEPEDVTSTSEKNLKDDKPSQKKTKDVQKKIIPEYLVSQNEKEIEKRQKLMEELLSKYDGCSECNLSEDRHNIVWGGGNPTTRLLIIGEAPGENEDITGIPFCGRAGNLLTKMLLAININRDDVYITNLVKCRPPANRNPHPDEILTCSPILKGQLEIIKPEFILTLGSFASKTLLKKPKIGITKLRGMSYKIDDYIVVPTYHPSALLRNESLKKESWIDLQVLRDIILDSTSRKDAI